MIDSKINDIEEIKSLQNDIFPKLKKCWGYNIWFIIQIQVSSYFYCISNKFLDSQELLKRNIPFEKRNYFSAFKSFLKALYFILCNYRKYKNKLNGISLLAGHRSTNIERKGCSYNTYLEPYQALLEKEGIKSEIIWLDEIYNNELFLSLYNIHFFILLIEKTLFPKQFYNIRYNANLVYSRLKGKYKDAECLVNIISYGIIINYLHFRIFRRFLKTLSPQRIWTYCYYDTDGTNPLIRAANSLHIETAEYQHSHFSDHHSAYTKWNYIDEYFSFFPKSFFVWNYIYKKIINQNFSGKLYIPEIIVSGNYYLKQEKSNIFRKSKSNDILVCLQGYWIPEFVENVIISSNNIKWYFRFHPRAPQDKEKLFSFASSNPDKVEIDKANRLTLHELFEDVGTILTISSGSALEAREFGLRVIIVGSYGYDSYKDYIVNGDFAYAENEDQLLKLVQRNER